MTRDEIAKAKRKRYRHVWGLFLQLPVREVARREGVTVSRIWEIVRMYSRMRQFRLWRQFPDPIISQDWIAKYPSGCDAAQRRVT